ncbi:MAG: hypothetical protein FJ100_02115 [Deltaproteobacteria bacterium]|nr:hypothetical protein [Deltaproteobacteria bacterium]
MQPVAVIDIGSNSVCLLVVARLRDGTLSPVAKHKHVARLRDALDGEGKLTADGLQRFLAALHEFARVLENWQVGRVRAVATAALRAAGNGDELVELAERETGIHVEIISGAEEARLAYLGVRHGLGAAASGSILCADVGGGSSELLVGDAGAVLDSVSTALGALVVARTLLGPDPVGFAQVDSARAALKTAFAEPTAVVGRHRIDLAVATSGTIQRVARIAQGLGGRTVDDVHRTVLTLPQLQMVIDALATAENQESRLKIPAMDPSRADNLLGGALIFEAVAELLGLKAWTVSMDGLRMGVVSELAGVW